MTAFIGGMPKREKPFVESSNAHARWIRMLAVTPDHTRIASVGDDMKTKLWDAATGECLATWGDYELRRRMASHPCFMPQRFRRMANG